MTPETITFTPGSRLPNGAVIKMFRADGPDAGVVLAKYRDELVVWTVSLATGDAFNGRYFDISQSIKARAYFMER